MTTEASGKRALVTFHGPVLMQERRGTDGQVEYVIAPLSDAALATGLCEQRERAAWYAGIDAALRVAEAQAVESHPLTLARLRAGLGALRHPGDRSDV